MSRCEFLNRALWNVRNVKRARPPGSGNVHESGLHRRKARFLPPRGDPGLRRDGGGLPRDPRDHRPAGRREDRPRRARQKGKVFERFEREAEILKQFRHPNIVRWLAWGRFKGTSYFAMEYVEGVTLERVIQERGELPWREVVDLGIQLCDALHYAHEKSVVHRDLKPSNLMITADGKLKLTDFGIAKDLDRTTQLTAPGRTLGTAAYMAPEQIRGTPAVSHKTDLYALGVLFYQMLTGKPPFEGASAVVLMHCHLNEPPPRPSARCRRSPGSWTTWWSS